MRISKKADVVQREVAGEVFLVPIHGHLADLQEMFVLNETGSWLWDSVDGTRSLDELAADLADVFEVDKETAVRDTEQFAMQLLDAGLADARDGAD